jgi:sugar/nucleoside kinase (ribokinase family)
MNEIVVLGDLCWDVYLGGMKRFPEMGAEVFAADGSMKPGGSAANTAMVLALCDCPVDLYSVVGDDSAGSRISQDLKMYGIDTSRISHMHGQQTGFTVVLSYQEKQERMLATSPGTLDKAGLDDFFPGYLKKGAHLHLSSYFIQARLAPEIGGLLELAKIEGMTTSLDPGHDPAGEWDISGLKPYLHNLDWFLPNEIEFMSITGGENLLGALEDSGLDPAGIVVKAGSDGAYLRLADEAGIMHFPPVEVDILDTTCAGDAFNAGFLLALSKGKSPGEAVLLGNRFGAICSLVMGLPREKDFFKGLTR